MRNLLKHIIIMFVIVLAGGAQWAFAMESQQLSQTIMIQCIDGEVIQDVPVSILNLCGYFKDIIEYMVERRDSSGVVLSGQSYFDTSQLIELLKRTVAQGLQNGSSELRQQRLRYAIVQDLTKDLSCHSIESFNRVISAITMADFFHCEVVENEAPKVIAHYIGDRRDYSFFSDPSRYRHMLKTWDRIPPRVQGEIKNLLMASLQGPDSLRGTYLSRDKGIVRSIAYSPDGSKLACAVNIKAHQNGIIEIWDLHRENEPKIFRDPTGEGLYAIAYSPDGKYLASGSEEGTINIWDLESGAPRTLEGHTGAVTSIAYRADGKQLASGSGDCTIKIWDLENKYSIKFPKTSGYVNSVAYSPDSNQLASGSEDGTITIWSIQGDLIRTLKMSSSHWQLPSGVCSIAYNHDGSQLACGGAGLVIWNLDKGEIFKVIHRDFGPSVKSIAYSPDGSEFAGVTCQSIYIWNSCDGSPLRELNDNLGRRVCVKQAGYLVQIAYHPRKLELAIGSDNGVISIWSLRAFEEFLSLSELALYIFLRDNNYGQRIVIPAPRAPGMMRNGEEHRIAQIGPNVQLYTKGLSFFHMLEHEKGHSITNSDDHFLGDLYVSMRNRIEAAHDRGELSAIELQKFRDSLKHVEVKRGS